MIDAKNRFKEGWIMLKRPFDFAELKKPLQKLTILYAFSEKPIIKKELTSQGREELDLYHDSYGRKAGLMSGNNKYLQNNFESVEDYDERMEVLYDNIIRDYETVENYQGEIVQCRVEGQLCRFYPEEYSIISKETFEHLLSCDDREYLMEIESRGAFETKEIKDKIHYIQNRGISKEVAKKMSAYGVKDAVIFRPGEALLQMFCRENEILK